MYNQLDHRHIPSEPPTDNCVRACQRRNLLITPDRRSFIQSMNHECARRISGNSVPSTSERGVFAYSFPTQYYAQGAALPSSSRYHTGVMGTAGTPGTPGRGDHSNTSAARIRYSDDPLEGYGTPNARPYQQGSTPVVQSSNSRSDRNSSGQR